MQVAGLSLGADQCNLLPVSLCNREVNSERRTMRPMTLDSEVLMILICLIHAPVDSNNYELVIKPYISKLGVIQRCI